MTRYLALAALIAVPTFTPSAAAGDCAAMGLSTTVVTKPGATIAGDGGILVAATYEARGSLDPGDRAVHPEWRVRAGKTLVAPQIDVLAPGLAVYRVEITSQTTPVELENDKHVVVASVVGSKAKLEVFPAPKLTKLEYHATISRHSSTRIEATLAGDAPKGAYALVIADAKGTPRSWGLVASGRTQLAYSHSDCGVLPNGTVVSSPGDQVTLFWVDTEGRRSEPTKPIKLAGKIADRFEP
jgi:hypothetical protein